MNRIGSPGRAPRHNGSTAVNRGPEADFRDWKGDGWTAVAV